MGDVVRLRHWRASRGSGSPAKNSSSGTPVARLRRAASENDGDRQPVSMREMVAGVVPVASATSCSESCLDIRCARSGCMDLVLPRWKDGGQAKLSITDKEVSNLETYNAPIMVTRIGPRKPRQGAYLREHRKSRNMGQDALAALLDTTAATISRYETGARDCPGGFLAALAEAYGIEVADLYRLPEPKAEVPQPPTFESMMCNAPPAIQEMARAAARAILETHLATQESPKTDKKRTAKK